MNYQVLGPAQPARQDGNGVYWQLYNIQYPDGRTGQLDFYYNGTQWVEGTPAQPQAVAPTSKISLLKKVPQTAGVVSLTKNYESLETTLVNLSKSSGINLSKHTARVAVCLDYSGSMAPMYRSGEVQEVLQRLFPIALQFDDDGQLEVWAFESRFTRLEPMTLNNFETYVKSEVIPNCQYGGTRYAPPLQDILKKHFSEEPAQIPTFVIFITDGANSDRGQTDQIIRQSSAMKIFIQFVGIGPVDDFDYLMKLDDLDGRQCDNTGFIRVKDMLGIPTDKLYNCLLEQYIPWLSVAPKMASVMPAAPMSQPTQSTLVQQAAPRKKKWGIF